MSDARTPYNNNKRGDMTAVRSDMASSPTPTLDTDPSSPSDMTASEGSTASKEDQEGVVEVSDGEWEEEMEENHQIITTIKEEESDLEREYEPDHDMVRD